MNWQLALVAVDVATIVCAALFGARVLSCFPRERNAQLIGLLCVAVISLLIRPFGPIRFLFGLKQKPPLTSVPSSQMISTSAS